MNARAIVVSLVLLAACVWWAVRDPSLPVPRGSGSASVTQQLSGVQPSSATGQSAATTATKPGEEPIVRSAVAPTLTIRGRLVTVANKPLAGVSLRLRVRRYEMDEQCWCSPGALHVPEPIPFHAPDPVVSASDGTFLFELPPTDLPLRVDAAGRFAVDAKCTRLYTELRQEPVYDAGDVIVHEGFVVRGTVVDQHGRAVPDTLLSLGAMHGYPVARVRNGQFDFGSVPAEDYEVDCLCGEAVTESVTVGPEHDTSSVRLVVRRLPILTCLAVDDRTGQPVPGQRFEPTLRDAEIVRGRPWTVYANDDGRIWIRGDTESGNAVQFADDGDDPEPTHYVVDPDVWYEFQSGQVVIPVRAWSSFKVRVQQKNGEAVPDFKIVTTKEYPRKISEVEPGVWQFSQVMPGKHFVYAQVEGAPFAVSRVHTFDPMDFAHAPLVMTVAPPTTLKLQLRTRDGTPLVANVCIRCTHPDDDGDVRWTGGDRWEEQATTGDDGTVTMLAPANLVGWELCVWKTATTDSVTVAFTDVHQAARSIEVKLPKR